MKKYLTLILSILMGLSFSLILDTNAFAKNKKKNPTAQTLKAVNNDGDTEVDGSVLNPRVNEVNILLSKQLLTKIKGIGLEKLQVTLTSTIDSTKTFSVPADGLNIQRKAIKKVRGQYLIVSLFNLTNSSGVTISPSSLPNDNYKLSISGTGLSATTDSFLYRTPALIVGTVDSKTTGLVSVDSLKGERISEGTVATNPNGTFFTEVRASKINSTTKARRYLKAQSAEETSDSTDTNQDVVVEEVDTGILNVEAEKSYSAVVDLSSDEEINAQKANKPIEVNDETTLTAQLAVEGAKEGNEDIAVAVAKEQLNTLSSGEGEPTATATPITSGNSETTNLSCDINQFANKCSDNDQALAAVGAAFKGFVKNANCSFPEFALIQNIIPKLPDDANVFIGKGYCQHATRKEDNNKPCEIYATILKNHQSGLEPGLPPCPPPGCPQFTNITIDNPDVSKRCFAPKAFCDNSASPQGQCIPKPHKDLYCAKVGTDIDASECKDDNFGGNNQFSPGFKIETADSDGAQYCVPSNFPKPTFTPGPGFIGPLPPSSSKDIANQCPVNACHRKCPQPQFSTPVASSFPGGNFQQDPSIQCHNDCEKAAGRFVDCNPLSDYFKKDQCCRTGPIAFAQTAIAFQTTSQPFSPSPTAPFFPPTSGGNNFNPPFIGPDVQSCLCSDPNNFDSKTGYAKKDAQATCKDKCPPGFEKDQNGNGCVKSCPDGTVRGPRGDCRKQCPSGFIQDDFGGCKCPDGQYPNPNTGKCEGNKCPDYCAKILSGGTSTATTAIPPECQACFGGPGVCPSGQRKDFATNACVPITCGPNQIVDQNGACKCPDGSYATSTGPDGCKNQRYCSPGETPSSTNPCITPTCPPPYEKNPSGNPPCKCPDATPINLNTNTGSTCVASCPSGLVADYPQYSGSPGTSMRSCLCPNKSYPNANGQCTSPTTNYCSPGIAPTSTNPCTCAPGGYFGSDNICKCSSPTQTYTKEYGCGSTNNRPCTAGEGPSNGCYCFAAGYVGSDGKCQCSGGVQYTGGGCGPSTSNYCSPGIAPTATNPCTCAPGGYFSDGNICKCSSTTQTYTKEYGCGSTTQCPTSTPVKCPDGRCVVSSSACTSTTNCPLPYVTNPAYNSSSPNGVAPCTCPSGKYYYNNDCVATCPNSLVTGVPTSGGGAGPIPSCLCPGTLQSPGANGQCTSSTSYCSPGISTSTGCSCWPNAILKDDKTCGCSSSTQTYTKEYGCGSTTQCPASTPYKCPNGSCAVSSSSCTSTTSCPSPYVTNPAYNSSNPNGVAPCTCPNGTYSYNYTCVATCPNSLVTGTPPSTGCGSGPIPSCLCPGTLQCPGANGQCSTTTSHTCALNEVSTSTNPCTCATGATLGSNGQCQCTNGQVYASGGCPGSTTSCTGSTPIRCSDGTCAATQASCSSQCPSPYVSNPSGTPPCKCPDATPISYGTTCVATCPAGLTADYPQGSTSSNSMRMCLCSDKSYPNANGQCSTTCTGGKIFDPAVNSCRCPNNQVETNGACSCPAGMQPDPNSPTNCITPQTINITSASITGNNLALSYTKGGFNECVLLVSTSGTILHNGVNSYGLLCSPSGGTVTNSLSNFNGVAPNSQIKLCKGNGTDTNTNTNLSTSNLCSPPITITTTDTITLTSVVRAANGDLTVTYSKNFADCVGLRQNNINGLRVTSQNQFCGTSGTQTVLAADLKSTVQVGTQIALCNDVSSFCSTPIAITGQ